MQKLMFLKTGFCALLMALSFISCKHNPDKPGKETDNSADIEVIYFYGKQRCSTCVAIERYAQEAIDSVFSQEIRDGKINFRSVDITTPEGERLADNFEVASSSLFIVDNSEDNPERIDMTAFGFKNARTNRKEYKQGIIDQINRFLKK